MHIMPYTVPATQIQKNYRDIFDLVRLKEKIAVVLNNNKADVAIVDVDFLEELMDKAQQAELADALQAVSIYEEEKSSGNLKEMDSLADLIDEN